MIPKGDVVTKETNPRLFLEMSTCHAILFRDVDVGSFNLTAETKLKLIKMDNSIIQLNVLIPSKKTTITLRSTHSWVSVVCDFTTFRCKITESDIESIFEFSRWRSISVENLAISPDIPSNMFKSQLEFLGDHMPSVLIGIPSQLCLKVFRKNMNIPSEPSSSSSSSSRHSSGRSHVPRRTAHPIHLPPTTSMPIIDLTREDASTSTSIVRRYVEPNIPSFAVKQPIDDKYVSCMACEEFAATVCFSPCSHHSLCADCYEMLKKTAQTNGSAVKCPECREDVVDKMFTAPYSIQRGLKTKE